MRKRLVVFDLDGTLVDSSRDLATAVNAALQEVAPGAPALSLPLVRSLIGNGARNLIDGSLRQAGLSRRVEDVLPVFLRHYEACLLETTRLYPGVAEGLAALAGRTLAVLSNKPGPMCRTILGGLGIAPLFARIWGAGDFPGRKPDPAPLQLLLADLGVSAGEALLVGDSAVDVQTARAAGVAVVGVPWGLDPTSLESAPPDRILESLLELRELC
ncbi:MAG TPA: HAD-IA family hydrolase [Vicinamibacteria bacterium]|nr:HAD-IA family hydrolase [Vicinamibacteria bacterium]